MKTPKPPEETPEQKAQRERARSENIEATQEGLDTQTNLFRNLRTPKISIATGRSPRISAAPVSTAAPGFKLRQRLLKGGPRSLFNGGNNG